MTSQAKQSKNEMDVTRNNVVTMKNLSSEQKNEVPQAKPDITRTPLLYARASELLKAANKPVNTPLPTLATNNSKVTPHATQRVTRSVSKQEKQVEDQFLQEMEGASLDDIYSNDYTFKDNLKSNPCENLPPSQHGPNSDHRPTPSLDENGTVFRNQNNDHDASN
jgi:hypothetical protein